MGYRRQVTVTTAVTLWDIPKEPVRILLKPLIREEFGTQFIILILHSKAKGAPHKKQGRETRSQEASASVLEDKPGSLWECMELKSIRITLPTVLCYFISWATFAAFTCAMAAQRYLLMGCCLKVPSWCCEAPLCSPNWPEMEWKGSH